MRLPFSQLVPVLVCTAIACGGRSNIGDMGVASGVGGASLGSSSGVAGKSTGSGMVPTGGVRNGTGELVTYGGVTATGGLLVGFGGTRTSGSSPIGEGGAAALGGAANTNGGANASGGTSSSKAGMSATSGTSSAKGGTNTTTGFETGTGGTSSSAQGGIGGRGSSAVGSGGVDATGGSGGIVVSSGGFAGGETSSACEDGRVLCGTGASAKCVDTTSDPNHCGKCNNACANSAVCWSGACEPPRCPPTIKFGALPTITTDRAAVAFAVGDLNADGYLDFATVNSSSNTVSALLGNGKGKFERRIDQATGNNPKAIAIRYLNRDGKLDLVTANYDADSVSVLLGRGDGTFDSAFHYSVGHGPVAMANGDFNGDGSEDIATLNGNAHTVSVLLSSGSGILAAAVDYATGTYPTAIVSGDFNLDGKLDLATTNGGTATVSVLLGVGDGSFIHAPDSAIGPGRAAANDLALGDLNSDGKLDLVVATQNGRYSTGIFGAMFGVGDGSFLPIVDYEPMTCRTVAAADQSGDGQLELVASDGRQAVSVLSLDSSGRLAGEASYPTPAPPTQVAFADFNGDSWLDIAALDRWGAYVLLATGHGKFDYPEIRPVDTSFSAVELSDLNGDGQLDLVATAYVEDTVRIMSGLGDGTFAPADVYPTGNGQGPIQVGDLDGDGRPDLVTANGTTSGVSVLWNAGVATYPYRTDYATETASDFLALGDLDNNGKLDILVATGHSAQESGITVLLNQGGGTFLSGVHYDLSPVVTLALADLDRDAKLDLVQTNGEPDGLTVRLGLGDGTFGATLKSANSHGWIGTAAAIGDLNGDGHPDLVVSDSGSSINVMLGVGDGTFTATEPQLIAGGYDVDRVALRDMNGDGKLDIVVHGLVGWVGFEMFVMLGAGDGTVSCSTASLADAPDPSTFALGDVNGDKRIDIVFPTSDANAVGVLLNQPF